MQIMMRDIRRWGGNKIFDTCGKEDFIDYLRSLERTKPVSAYSVPKLYVNGLITKTSAIKDVLTYCEPMIDVGVSDLATLQRKFRNTWNSIWKYFALDNNLNEEAELILNEFGLSDQLEASDDIITLYNKIIKWYLISNSEQNLEENNLDMMSTLNALVLNNNYDFTYKFISDLK